MLDISLLDNRLGLCKFSRQFRFVKFLMLFDRIPSSKQDKLLVLSFFINSPTTKARIRSSKYLQILKSRSEKSVELGFVTLFDKAPRYSNDRR